MDQNPFAHSFGFNPKKSTRKLKARTHASNQVTSVIVHFEVSQKRKYAQSYPLADRTNILPFKKQKPDYENLYQKSLAILVGKSSDPRKNPSSIQPYEPRAVFLDLPAEILLEVFRLLPALSRGRSLLVCRKWKEILFRSQLIDCIYLDEYVMLIRNSIRHSKRVFDFIASSKHPEISSEMRSVLVDWLVEVGDEFKLQSETVFLTVNLVDRYLAFIQTTLSKTRFQLVGVAALLIASKIEERSPLINDLVYICDNAYSKQEIIAMELSILSVLGFELTIFSPRNYVHFLLQFIYDREPNISDADRTTLSNLSYYLVDLSLYDLSLSLARPSVVAASAVSLARSTMNLTAWTTPLAQETFLTLADLHHVGNTLYELFKTVQHKLTQQALFNKYSHPNFHQVANIFLRRSN